eukprot:TRINITY_DN2600_c0_g2_i1.p1 TRINITY_DN2600_c0_g2~~TRINITY_DN2600_c0_g2_i1.p1  ORF type:complete len:328 (+),score=68.72 TRINITY_DN2600_c0_g2_i1:159-1142(+)
MNISLVKPNPPSLPSPSMESPQSTDWASFYDQCIPDIHKAIANGDEVPPSFSLPLPPSPSPLTSPLPLSQHLCNTLLESTSVDQLDVYGNSAMHMVALSQPLFSENLDIVARLHEKQPSLLDHPDQKGRTPMHITASTGNEDLMIQLLQLGANPHSIDDNGDNVLHIACRTGNSQLFPTLFSSLLQQSTEQLVTFVNAENAQSQTPLHIACENGHSDCVTMLLDAGAQIEVVDQQGHTPLQKAIQQSHVGCVEVLMLNDADPLVIDVDGKSCFHWAAQQGIVDIVDMIATLCRENEQQTTLEQLVNSSDQEFHAPIRSIPSTLLSFC